MAKGRKSEVIKRITKCDGETIKAAANTGIISKDNAKKYFGLNDKRINLLVKNQYLVEKRAYTKYGNQIYYKLGPSGVKYVKENTNIDYFYRSNSTQLNHDLKLNQVYCQLTHEQRQCWINEEQIINRWTELTGVKERRGSVDALVQINGQAIAIEIITKNYGEVEIQEKQDAAENLGCERIIMINA